jgi:hypothetical protein
MKKLTRAMLPKKLKLPPQEAKAEVALTFECLGGVKGLADWASGKRQSNAKLDFFYTQMYTQNITQTVMTSAAVTINGESTQAKLEQLFDGLIRTRNGSDATLVIEHRSDESAGTSDQEPPAAIVKAVDAAPESIHPVLTDRAATPPEVLESAPDRTARSPPPPDNRLSAQRTSAEPPSRRPTPVPRRPDTSGNIVAGICLANALPSADRELTTTERFYLWSGNSGWRL